jgi:hypothetical protein
MYVLKQLRHLKMKCRKEAIIDILLEYCQSELRAYEMTLDDHKPLV